MNRYLLVSGLLLRLGIVVLLVSGASLSAQGDTPGHVRWGFQRWTEYVVGNAPIVISMAHGGYLKPAAIPDRTYGVTVQDGRTQETGQDIAAALRARFGLHPHLIINHLHRIKLDANREIVEAAQGDPGAERAWRDFHSFTAQARAAVAASYGKGLYIDLHGHGHPIDWVELGYLLSASDLNRSDAQLNASGSYASNSSIRSMVAANPALSFAEILRGPHSLGGLLEARGLLVVPAPNHPGPGVSSYFRGGYNTARWGSQGGGAVDGVQIELPSSMRRDLNGRATFVADLVDSLQPFCSRFYGIDLAAGGRLTIAAALPIATEAGERGVFVVTRTGSLQQPLPVELRYAGSASSGVDYEALPSTVTIPAGAASVEVAVSPRQDTAIEGQETVVAELVPGALPAGLKIGALPRATVIVIDDEAEPHRIAHWDLDEVAGDRARDRSGAGRDGRLRPAVAGPAWTSGLLSGAVEFDENEDRVEIADFDYASQNTWTLAFWFKIPPSSQSSTQYLFSHGSVNAANSLNIYWFEATGVLRTRVRCRTDITADLLLDVGQNFMDDRWHSYVLTVATGLSYASVYVDGILQRRNQLAGDDLNPTGSIVLGGRHDLSSSRYLRGRLDDVQLWDRALSPAEVQAFLAAGAGDARRFGAGCATSANHVPEHNLRGKPGPGRFVSFDVSGAAPAQSAVLFVGASRSRLAGGTLPLDLGFMGAAGCLLLQDALFRVPMALFQGAGAFSLGVPADPSLRGLRIHSQVMVLDPQANAAGLAVSNGVEAAVGG